MRDADYQSVISRFIRDFSRYHIEKEITSFDPNLGESKEADDFRKNFDYIKDQIDFISSGSNEASKSNTLDCEIISPEKIERRGVRYLFGKLDDMTEDGRARNKILSSVSKESDAHTIIRLILFASYMMKCIVLTRVKTDDESSAFDIFDALNTTGEPLTAVETLKPQVMQYEIDKEKISYGSPSEQAFDRINDYINKRSDNSHQRQTETKELIVSYALYVDGTKQSKDLSSQRRYLRSRFEKIKKIESAEKIKHIKFARQFVTNLEDMASFRQQCWNKEGIGTLATSYSSQFVNEVQLCLQLLRDMSTSLAVPPLARFWLKYREDNNDKEFLDAVRALTAFIVLRRAATGTTAGIDAQLRSLMKPEEFSEDRSLCVGLKNANTPPTLEDFRSKLRNYLSVKPIEVVNEETWLIRAIKNPLAEQNGPLTRFLLLAAADQSKPDSEKPGLWSRVDVVESSERAFLTYEKWTNDRYSTIEHVAPVSPDSESTNNWGGSIYHDPYSRHTLGNLILLPEKENSSAGNADWEKKKLLYLAFTADTITEQKLHLQTAQDKGFQITQTLKGLIEQGERLPLLDPLNKVESWDLELIKDRTENICHLAWSKIAPWLFS